MEKELRAEILVDGKVQGVGFRFFVHRIATNLRLNGFTKNLPTGQVMTIVEGQKEKIEQLYESIKVGTSHSFVENYTIFWSESKNEFNNFEIRI
ncbi:MAG: acylphosphatase [Ignavibacteriales bacterium]|nr:acylphosphatase [Ignavibacteriales bacterium]